MAPNLIAITGVIYAYVAFDLWLSGKTGLSLAYCGYAFANAGLWMVARG